MREVGAIVEEVLGRPVSWRPNGFWLPFYFDPVVHCDGKFGVHFVKLHLDPDDDDQFLGLAAAVSQKEIQSNVRGSLVNDGPMGTLGACVLAFLLAGGLSWWFVSRPLNSIIRAIQRMADGDYQVSLPVKSKGEIGDLARSFESMARQVRERSEALRDNERRLRTILATLAEGIIITDKDGTIQSSNVAAERIFGYERDELRGRSIAKLNIDIPAEDEPEEDEESASGSRFDPRRRVIMGHEALGTRKDGSTFRHGDSR